MFNTTRMAGPACAPCAPCGPAFTTRRPVTGTYNCSPGWFGARRVTPGYSNYSSGWGGFGGYRSSFYGPSYHSSWSTPYYSRSYTVHANPAAGAAFSVGVGAFALGVLLSL